MSSASWRPADLEARLRDLHWDVAVRPADDTFFFCTGFFCTGFFCTGFFCTGFFCTGFFCTGPPAEVLP